MTDQDDSITPVRRILWSDQAVEDLKAIGDFIAADDPDAALRWVERLLADVERAAELPLTGRAVPEFADRRDLREILRRTYRIVFQVREESIQVLTIFEGHRLFPTVPVPDPAEPSQG